MSSPLSNSIQYLKFVGPKRAEAFNQIGIYTIKDLLYYFPTRYLDRSTILTTLKTFQHIRNGYEGEITIVAKVCSAEIIRYHRKTIMKVEMTDKTGRFDCVWFQGIKYFKDVFEENIYFAISGKAVITKYGHLQFVHPDFDKLDKDESKEFLNSGRIIPFYSIRKELRAKNLGDIGLRRIIHQAVIKYSDAIRETLPEYLINENQLLELCTAIKNLHFPKSFTDLGAAKERMKFEELFYLQMLVALRKNYNKYQIKGKAFRVYPEPIKKLLKTLNFSLTQSQLKVLSEIRHDMESDTPMNRLLQGDVGSGKTIVALIAMIIAVTNNSQAVLMVPTEILASQHYKRMKELLEKLEIDIVLLIGNQTKKIRNTVLSKINSEEKLIIVGTHALFEEKIEFRNLGLVIIDEQHRFGVAQRLRLISKGFSPDVLVMTATPIPRTLAMTVYGDLEISTIDEMPSNRIPIKTYLRPEHKLPEVYDYIKSRIKAGEQVYIIFPLIEESGKLDLKAAEIYYVKLKEEIFFEYSVGLIHGRMKWEEKENIMNRFHEREFDILVATTVIEVGIDVPNANVIVINDAHRFGLSQLHQLRGRVGRGSRQAICILITNHELINKKIEQLPNFEYLSPLQIEKNKSIIRLNSLVKFNSGFDLAEIDLKLRGPGDIFGTKQSGLPELTFADIIHDYDLLMKTKNEAFKIVEDDADLSKEKNFPLKKILKENFSDHITYSNIA